MGNKAYWWLFIRAHELNLSHTEIGGEIEVSRLVGESGHKLLEEHYEASKPGDELIVSIFGSINEVLILGEIVENNPSYIKFRKTNSLKRPISNDRINNNPFISEKGLPSEIGTLKPMDAETYFYIVDELIGQDNLVVLNQTIKTPSPSIETPKAVIEPAKENPIAQAVLEQESPQNQADQTNTELQVALKLILKVLENSDSKEDAIKFIKTLID